MEMSVSSCFIKFLLYLTLNAIQFLNIILHLYSLKVTFCEEQPIIARTGLKLHVSQCKQFLSVQAIYDKIQKFYDKQHTSCEYMGMISDNILLNTSLHLFLCNS